MSARQPDDIEGQLVTPGFSDRLPGQVDREGEIVTRRDEAQWTRTQLWQTIDEGHGTNW